jgi:hypothetical protein
MRLRLERDVSRFAATIGRLFVDDVFECFILEDAIREQPGKPVALWKVKGRTAIPAGTYAVVITESARFRRPLPLLVDVPGFSGIRIHSGNTHEDTEGCLIPGRARGVATVKESGVAFRALFAKLEAAIAAGEQIHISIVNPALEASLARAA